MTTTTNRPAAEGEAHEFVESSWIPDSCVRPKELNDWTSGYCSQPRDAAIHRANPDYIVNVETGRISKYSDRLASDTRPCTFDSCPFDLPRPHSINDHPMKPSPPAVEAESDAPCEHGNTGYCFDCVRKEHSQRMADGDFDCIDEATDTQTTYAAHLKQCRICYHGLCNEGRRLWEANGRQPAEIPRADIGSEAQAVPPERIFLRACHPGSPNHNCSWGVDSNRRGSVEYVLASTTTGLAEALREMTQVVRRVDYPESVEGQEAVRGAEAMALAITEAVDKFYEAALAKYEGKGQSG